MTPGAACPLVTGGDNIDRRKDARFDMIPKFAIKAVVIILIAVVVTAALGWAYSEHRKRELHDTVLALVKDTSLQLREALNVDAGSAAANPETGRKLDEHVATVERHFLQLRSMDTDSVRELAEAADDYLLTAREILRRQASSYRYRLQLAESLKALRNHMHADDRSESWVQEAVRAKERVDQEYREYRLPAEALAKLLESFPVSRAKIAPHVDAALLPDGSLVETAHRRTLEAVRQAADEIEKAKQLASYR